MSQPRWNDCPSQRQTVKCWRKWLKTRIVSALFNYLEINIGFDILQFIISIFLSPPQTWKNTRTKRCIVSFVVFSISKYFHLSRTDLISNTCSTFMISLFQVWKSQLACSFIGWTTIKTVYLFSLSLFLRLWSLIFVDFVTVLRLLNWDAKMFLAVRGDKAGDDIFS